MLLPLTPIAIATAFSPLIPEPLGETVVPAQGVVDIPYMVHIVHVLLLLYSVYNSWCIAVVTVCIGQQGHSEDGGGDECTEQVSWSLWGQCSRLQATQSLPEVHELTYMQHIYIISINYNIIISSTRWMQGTVWANWMCVIVFPC